MILFGGQVFLKIADLKHSHLTFKVLLKLSIKLINNCLIFILI